MTAAGPAMGSMPIVAAHSLGVRVGRRLVLRAMDLDVQVGVHGLLGRNGAGKTTLLRTVATLLKPASGSLSLFGEPVKHTMEGVRALRSQIGYAPQAPAVLPQMTVLEQASYAAWLKGMSDRDARQAAAVALDRVGLTDRMGDRTGRLSGGMIKRLSTAMAIVATPKLILLDEPTAGLDPEQRVRFRELARDLGRESAVVLSTHLIEDVVAVCTSVTVIREGQRVFHGPPDQMGSAGRSPRGMSTHEEAFMALTGGPTDA